VYESQVTTSIVLSCQHSSPSSKRNPDGRMY
jgi:hypothetical protein